ncbi:glycosyltransferase 87 family protein [Butyrivibrio sp. WCD3002]|uniref:glycosyltransferase 87 family protein n=1 Tax=Butyrivibrio sp. WCD3002 TaxID=1280676 RepID=UPI000414C0AA|nr:glycosyltransferase 87 family protein [Butyrivibrio sp. WCD3002]
MTKNKASDRVIPGIMILIAVVARLLMIPEVTLSPDYNSYYLPWVNAYREYGIITGLGKNIGDYYVPYNIMYAICSLFPVEPYIPLAVFSFIAEIVSALYIRKIVLFLLGEKGVLAQDAERKANYAAALSLLLPFVVFNGALWKQCDAIYVVFIVIAVYYLLKDQYRAAFIFFAISFGFKLQAILFVPFFFMIYLIKKGFSILEFGWIPVMYLIMGLPSVLCKKGLRDTYFAYMSQTQETTTEGYGMVSYYPNIYNFGLDNLDKYLKLPAIALTAGILLGLVIYAYRKKDFLQKKENAIVFGLLMAWTCTMFLPGMHERYDYAIVLLMTTVCAFVKRELWPIVLVMNICSLLVYVIVLFGQYDISMIPISIAEIVAYVCFVFYVFKISSKEKAA